MGLDERVLVVPTQLFHSIGLFQGFCPRPQDYLPRLLDPRHLSYRPRSEVETDPSFKQLIPYVVLRHADQLFHYTRGQSTTEARLRALRSVGIGGHICENDGTPSADAYPVGMRREIEEEVILDTDYSDRCIGLINDDSTPVGQVHLGIVHVFELAQPLARRREESLTEAGFAPLRALQARREDFETWSRFVLDALSACERDPMLS